MKCVSPPPTAHALVTHCPGFFFPLLSGKGMSLRAHFTAAAVSALRLPPAAPGLLSALSNPVIPPFLFARLRKELLARSSHSKARIPFSLSPSLCARTPSCSVALFRHLFFYIRIAKERTHKSIAFSRSSPLLQTIPPYFAFLPPPKAPMCSRPWCCLPSLFTLCTYESTVRSVGCSQIRAFFPRLPRTFA